MLVEGSLQDPRLVFYGIGDMRQQRHLDRFNLVFFCREARQPASEVEQLPLSEYQARRTCLHQILEEQGGGASSIE